jgi:HSP20 family protein
MLMTPVRWDPFGALNSLQGTMNRLFADIGGVPARLTSGEAMDGSTWTPAVDIFERDDAYVIAVALPGVDPKKVQVDLDGSVLAIHGERMPDGVKLEEAQSRESVYGPFYRAFTLPASADSTAIRAEYEHGMLLITAPKSEAAKPKQITVKAA